MINQEIYLKAHKAADVLRSNRMFPAALNATLDQLLAEFACQQAQEAFQKAEGAIEEARGRYLLEGEVSPLEYAAQRIRAMKDSIAS